MGRDLLSFHDDYRHLVEASLRVDDPLASTLSRSVSRRSDSRASRHSQSFTIRPPSSSVDVASQATPVADKPWTSRPREVTEVSDDSESISKCTRAN